MLLTLAILAGTAWNLSGASPAKASAIGAQFWLEVALVLVGVLASEFAGSVRKEWRVALRVTVLVSLLLWIGALVWLAVRSGGDFPVLEGYVFRTTLLAWAVSNVVSGIAACRGRSQEPQRTGT